jgi:hypothetical protein
MNTLVTPSWIVKSVATGYMNEIKFVSNMDRQYDDSYEIAGAKVGYTVQARLPQRFQATHGQALQTQALYDQTVPITLNDQINTAWSYSTASATQEVDDARARYVQPAAETLANACDVLAYTQCIRDVYSSVGTPGTTPSTVLTYLQAGTKLTDLAVGQGRRIAVLDPLAMQTIANTTSLTFFNPQATISENYRNGRFAGNQLGIEEWFQDANAYTHTTGSFTAATPLVDGANQTGSTININGWASGATALKKGDIFTIAGVYGVNPISYVSTARLQQFVITADTNDATGVTATLPISPPIITSGALQTVTVSPADDAVVLVWSATSGGALAATPSRQSVVFTKDAFAFVMADLVKPTAGAEVASVRSKQFGISIRMVSQYQIGTDQMPTRLDILVGAATIQPRFACRVVG